MKYYKKIIGEKVYLSPINIDDYEIYTKWLNDEVVAKNIAQYTNLINEDSEKEFLNNLVKEKYNFSIILKENDRIIGNISLKDFDAINQKAELGIFIGDDKDRGKGYGTDAIKILLNYGFNYLNLNNIMLKVFSYNNNALKVYEKVGFKKFGIRKEVIYSDGIFYDEIYMQYLKCDFKN